MITIIVGTNRKGSESEHFAKCLQSAIEQGGKEEVKFLNLAEIPHDWFHHTMYVAEKQAASLTAIQDDCILPANKLIFVIPEYNGSFPGVVKLFIDACSIREYIQNFKGKKAAIMGVSSGRAGNLRGMEHLTGVLNYLGTHVMPNRLPVSSCGSLLNKEKQVKDTDTLTAINSFAVEILAF